MFSVAQINALRRAETERIVGMLGAPGRLLELGAGTGEQALELTRRGFDVVAVDLASSVYAANRKFPVIEYDGTRIPLPDASVDIVYSSYMLEYVTDLRSMHAEIRRVLKPAGYCVHVLPTPGWRFWTLVCGVPNALVSLCASVPQMLPHALPGPAERLRLGRAWRRSAGRFIGALVSHRHGERGSVLTELWRFRAAYWRRNFSENGFVVLGDQPIGVFYTGHCLCGPVLGLTTRARLARVLGSAGRLYRLAPAAERR